MGAVRSTTIRPSLLGAAAVIACTGNPIEAAPTLDPATSSDGSGGFGDTAEVVDTSTASAADGGSVADLGTPDSDGSGTTTGAAAVCADGVHTPGEWCWDPPFGVMSPGAPLDATAADVDGDGSTEIVLANGTLLVPFAQQGWTAGVPVSLSYAARALRSGDIDGDGFDDVVAIDDVYGLWTSNGSAAGLTAPTYQSTSEAAATLAVDDVDGDGFLDAVAGSASYSTLMYYGGSSAGTFAYMTSALVGSASASLALTDLDGDGLLDAIVSTLAPSLDVAMFQPAMGTPPVVTSHVVPGGYATVTSADFDDDGVVDVARLDHDTGIVRLWKGTGGPLGEFVDVAVAPSGRGLASADFDADGDIDLVVLTGSGLLPVENAGEVQFMPLDEAPLPGGIALRTHDLDRDGTTDVFVVTTTGFSVITASP